MNQIAEIAIKCPKILSVRPRNAHRLLRNFMTALLMRHVDIGSMQMKCNINLATLKEKKL